VPSVEQLRRELKDTEREVRNLSVMGMRPDLTAHKRDIIRQLERSARAEVQLRVKALEHELGREKAAKGP
jgi:hypothetical protein